MMIDFKIIQNMIREYFNIPDHILGIKIYQHFKNTYPEIRNHCHKGYLKIYFDDLSSRRIEIKRYTKIISYHSPNEYPMGFWEYIKSIQLDLHSDILEWSDEDCLLATMAIG